MMEVSKENSTDAFMEIDVGSSLESFQKFLESQKELFHSQAAGALSIKIGKRPRDLLNPKAVKYMQSVFSIKDMISKKEFREISALCGVTVTQVREFFAGQRSRVRKLARLSKEKVVRSKASKAFWDGSSTSSDPAISIDQILLNPVDSKSVEGVPSCSLHEEALPDIDNSDLNFLENIFNLMRKEETFSGQVKLMDWILLIQNSSVLYWFVTKGGLVILTTWLSQAALEEQTTVLLIIFKVLCHLPLHKALPIHMSAILQTVNRLRFYRSSDISNRARVLLSRLSKLFVRSQVLKRPNSMQSPNAAQKEIRRKQRMGEILTDEAWQSKVDLPEEILALTSEGAENSRKPDPPRTLKLLPASADDPSQRHVRSVSSPYYLNPKYQYSRQLGMDGNLLSAMSKVVAKLVANPTTQSKCNSEIKRFRDALGSFGSDAAIAGRNSHDPEMREHRKVILVEQQGQKTDSRSLRVARAVPAKPGRPMSADDIRKAKMRAVFMRTKYGMISSSSGDGHRQKTEDPMKPSASQRINFPSASKTLRPKIEEDTNSSVVASTSSPSKLEEPIEPKAGLDHQESLQEKFRRDQISWQIPPEVRINGLWRIGTGEKSKEAEVQTERIRREKETVYHSNQEIPPNPKEPWDLEIDYDDTLTPEIPIEQSPDATTSDVTESLASPIDKGNAAAATSEECCSHPAITSNGCAPEPDLELLAVLLKNPQLVFALTSGQGSNLTSADTVRLLDMIKASGVGLPRILDGMGVKAEENVELISLPSPTPAADNKMGGWRSEGGNDRFSQPVSAAYSDMAVTSTIPSMGKLPFNGSLQPQIPCTYISSSPQMPTVSSPMPQQLRAALQLLSSQQVTGAVFPEKQLSSIIPPLSQQSPTSPPISEAVLPMKQPKSVEFGQMHILKPATVSIVLNSPNVPALLPNPRWPHPSLLPDPPPFQPLHTTWFTNSNAAASGKQSSMADYRNVRQFTATSPHFQANQHNCNAFPQGLMPPTSFGPRNNEFVGEPELETWSPERSPLYQSGPSFPRPRSVYGQNSRPDQSRQWNSGYRERRNGRRWSERRH